VAGEEVVELFRPPRLADLVTFSGELFVTRRLDGMDIEQGPVDIEYECFGHL